MRACHGMRGCRQEKKNGREETGLDQHSWTFLGSIPPGKHRGSSRALFLSSVPGQRYGTFFAWMGWKAGLCFFL